MINPKILFLERKKCEGGLGGPYGPLDRTGGGAGTICPFRRYATVLRNYTKRIVGYTCSPCPITAVRYKWVSNAIFQ